MSLWYRLVGHDTVPDPTARLQPAEERRVARTQIGPEVHVSTVFLGLDHQHGVGGPPILFETMIFGLEEEEDYQERYATWDEAEAGHARAVDYARAALAQRSGTPGNA
jgi:hypothetical protein